jgi:hypothetical protein
MDIHEWLTIVPENQWLVNGLIANQSLNMIKAPRETGKTLLVCEFCRTYVMGEPEWLGRKYEDDSRGKVFYMVTDANAEADVSRQLANLGVPAERVKLARHNGEDLGTVNDWTNWGAWLQAQGISVLVVDNGTGMSNGVVDTEATGNLFKKLRAMTGPMGLTVILVHHEKNGGGTAGNYSWESETRWRLTLTAPSGNPWNDDYRELSFKGNLNPPEDMPGVIPLRMPRRSHPGSRFTLTGGRNATAPERSPQRPDEQRVLVEKILALGRQDWKSQREIAEAIGSNQTAVSRAFNATGYTLRAGAVTRA